MMVGINLWVAVASEFGSNVTYNFVMQLYVTIM